MTAEEERTRRRRGEVSLDSIWADQGVGGAKKRVKRREKMKIRRTVISKQSSSESLSHRNDVGMSYPPPSFYRSESTVVLDLEA